MKETAYSLRQLEHRLLSQTIAWIRRRWSEGGLTPTEYEALSKQRHACEKELIELQKVNMALPVKEFLQESLHQSKTKAHANLRIQMGTIVELFGATCASLLEFITIDGKASKLQEIATYNLPQRVPLWFSCTEQDASNPNDTATPVLAAIRRHGILVNDTTKMRKTLLVKNSASARSQLSVPVLGTNRRTVVGILVLESSEANSFLSFHVGELQSAVWQLLPDLLIFQHARRPGATIGWHPQKDGWDPSTVVQELIDNVCRSGREGRAGAPPICTTWRTDWKKASLFAWAVSGFNYEYIGSRIMPLASAEQLGSSPYNTMPQWLQLPAASWMSAESSRTAGVALQEPGFIHSGPIPDEAYNRSKKAERMNINYLMSTPIYGDQFSNEGDLSIGVASFYFTEGRTSSPWIPQEDFTTFLKQLSGLLGTVDRELTELRSAVVVAQLFAKLNRDGIPFVNLAVCLKEVVKMCLCAEFCSVFVAHRKDGSDPEDIEVTSDLYLLSTTGLESRNFSGIRNLSAKCRFVETSDEGRFSRLQGFTGFLAANPNTIIRKLDIPDDWEIGVVNSATDPAIRRPPFWWRPAGHKLSSDSILIEPGNALTETAEPTTSDHRRIIATSVGLRTEGTTGIVRTLRSAGSRPFTEDEARLLYELSVAFGPCFRIEWDNIAEASRPGSGIHRLNDNNVGRWNRRLIDAALQCVLEDLDAAHDTIHEGLVMDTAYIRTRSLNKDGSAALRLYTHFSRRTNQLLTERRNKEILKDDTTLEWVALENCCAFLRIWRDEYSSTPSNEDEEHNELTFYPTGRGSGNANIIFAIPFGIGSNSEADSLLCAEGHFVTKLFPDGRLNQILFDSIPVFAATARILSWLARDNAIPKRDHESSATLWPGYEELINELHKNMNAEKLTRGYRLEPLPLAGGVYGPLTISLWYGCVVRRFKLHGPANFEKTLRVKVPTRNMPFVKSNPIKEMIRRLWQELVLKRPFSPELVKLYAQALESENILDQSHVPQSEARLWLGGLF